MVNIMKQNAPKKEKLLDSASQLMLEKGYVATTIDQICADADVTKGSFFHYFKSKDDIGKEVVSRFASYVNEGMNKFTDTCGEDPLERIYGYLDAAIMFAESPESKGCLVGMFTQEMSQSHPEIRTICEHAFDQMMEPLTKYFGEAKEKYANDKLIDPRSLAETYIAMVQGSMILTKANKDKAVMRRTMNHYREYLGNLFKN